MRNDAMSTVLHGSNRSERVTIRSRGFTLVETLIALFVLTIGLVGPIGLASKTLRAGQNAEDKVTAVYLAQEATEFVKNIRDSNIERKKTNPAAGFLDGLGACVNAWCEVETSKPTLPAALTTCSGTTAAGCSRKFKYHNNKYFYDTAPNTDFQRAVRITHSGHEAIVDVVVSYLIRSVPYTATVRTVMYDLGSASSVAVPVCGNGVCEWGESAAQCPSDCGAGASGGDTDNDSWPDAGDNCWCVANPTQQDSDGDGVGNVCDWGHASFVKCCSASCGQ